MTIRVKVSGEQGSGKTEFLGTLQNACSNVLINTYSEKENELILIPSDISEFKKLFNVSPDAAVEANRKALLDRSNVGIVKYGTTLMDNKGDLRYWLNHALEECLDQANYLRRAIMEIDNKKECTHSKVKWNIQMTSGTCQECGEKIGNP